jgi:acyl transferase domain-containing protein
MQYASTQCWIDSGLQPSAIIGHSLGELTALAVSGVLSLTDAIKLVASRAQLIDAQWGPEKGSMVALGNCSTQEFDAISSTLEQKTGHMVVIACYNALNAIVAAGTSTAIDHLEDLLRTEPDFQKIRTRHLTTSHGFYSHLTEPLLNDLAALSQSLEWNEPKIPLETCSNILIDSFKHYEPSRH